MKAAVLHQAGATPAYENFPDPIAQPGQLLITMRAASVKNLDKLRASGKHYASYTEFPAVVGIDGVGILPDGTRIYAQGVTGMIAEKALVQEHMYTVLPDGLDDVTAAALPNAAIGAAMALVFRAKMQKGETVLINGATGVTGKLAVQLARYYGASRIVVTGRNAEILEQLKAYGAHEIISLNDSDENIVKRIRDIHSTSPIDIVIDYLWGHPVELIITALKGGGLHTVTPRVRLVTVGSMAGENIQLASGTLRSSAIELLGSGIGSLSRQELMEFGKKMLPELFRLAADGKLVVETETADLKDIEAAWNGVVAPGKRLVIRI